MVLRVVVKKYTTLASLMLATFIFSISSYADSVFFTEKYSKISNGIQKKLESCQNIAIDGYSYSDCISSAIDDEDKYLGFLRAEIKQNIKNNNLILSEFDRDINCNENIKNTILNNNGSMWPGVAMEYCAVSKDAALKKWSYFYDVMKGSEQYENNLKGIFNE